MRSKDIRTAQRLVLVGLLIPGGVSAQVLPFHTETAITTGFEEQAARTFSMFSGRQGLLLDGVAVPDSLRREINVFVQPLVVLPYAITPMWTTRLIAPFVHKSVDFAMPGGAPLDYSTGGVGDIIVDTKWVFLSQNRLRGTTRLGIEGGVKIPVGTTDAAYPDGTVAPRMLQVGTGSWDFPFKALFTMNRDHFGLLANVGYRLNTRGDDFKAGNVFTYDVATGLRFLPWAYRSLKDQTLVVYLELNGEVAAKSEIGGVLNPDSGGHLVFLSPDLQWIPLPWLLFEGSVQFPIVQDLNGTQLEYETRFQFGTRIRFSFLR